MHKIFYIFQVRSFLGRSLFGFRFLSLFYLIGRQKKLLVNSSTEICIEGYPRSANTFAVLAFKAAQKEKVAIAHHMHLAGQVLDAVNRGVPSIVLIREPLDASISLLLREPNLSARLCLRLYLDFYKPLIPYLDQVVVASFDQVTSDYSLIIEQLNDRFSSSFGVYKNSEILDSRIFWAIDALPSREDQMRVAHPTKEKEAKKREVIAEFQSPECKKFLESCREVYLSFLGQVSC